MGAGNGTFAGLVDVAVNRCKCSLIDVDKLVESVSDMMIRALEKQWSTLADSATRGSSLAPATQARGLSEVSLIRRAGALTWTIDGSEKTKRGLMPDAEQFLVVKMPQQEANAFAPSIAKLRTMQRKHGAACVFQASINLILFHF